MNLLFNLFRRLFDAYRFATNALRGAPPNNRVVVRECVSGRWVRLAEYVAVQDVHIANAGDEARHAVMDMSLHFDGRTKLHFDTFERTSIHQVRTTLPSMRERAALPTKRVYLVAGARGTKKTSLLCAVASNFAKRVCWVDGRTPLGAVANLDPQRDLVAIRTHHFESRVQLTDALRSIAHLYWRETLMVVILHDGDLDSAPSGIDTHVDYVLCTPTYATAVQHEEVYTRMLGGTDEIDRERFLDIMGNHRCSLSLIERWIMIRAPDVMLRMHKLSNTLHTFRNDSPLQCLRHHERIHQPIFEPTNSTVSPESSA